MFILCNKLFAGLILIPEPSPNPLQISLLRRVSFGGVSGVPDACTAFDVVADAAVVVLPA